ncbi:PAS domain S-box protein [uncultured Draconibacterium sp.]|uniref:PAS domain S-box protein n=1 Tax=uncultured Draconibacterium sp. TaxID=1573823 RepID=UPI0029C651EF|nr:PAS domain S-box protein [uncultured Draconibacterium sp.]
MKDSEKSREQLIEELNKLRGAYNELKNKNNNQTTTTENSLLADIDFSSKVMESLPGIFYIYTYPELRLVLWNKNHEHLLGYKHNEIGNRYIMDWHVPGAESAVQEAIDYVMKHGQNTIEAPLVHKNGEIIPFLLNGIRFESANQQYLLGFGIKITEQKKLEQELKESEALFRLMAENSTDMIARHDKNGVFIYASPSCRTLLGFTPEELVGRSAFEFIHPDDLKLVEDSLQSISKESYISTTTFRIRCKDGNYTWFETKSKAIFDDETHEVVEIHASSRDVTARVLAKQKLKENEQKLNALFTSMTEMVVLHDLVFDENKTPVNYRIIDCNDAFTKITGIPKEQAVGKLSTEVYQTQEAPYLKEFSGVAISGKSYEYESYFAPMDKYFMISVVSPAKNKFATITSDITQMKLIQESIKSNEEKQRSMIANISDVIAIVDKNGNNAYKSPNIERIFGWKPEELIGKSTFDLVHPDDLLIAQDFFTDLLAGSESSSNNFEFRYRCKDNSYKWVALTATNQLDNPVINGILLNYRDINPKKEAETELILAKEKAEEANKLKTEFLNNMSHEIRTPMNGIIGFSEMLDEPNISDEKRRYYSKIVQNSSHQLLRIIDDILEISTLETKQEKLNETEFSLNDLIMELFSIFDLNSKERNIPIYVKKALPDEQSNITTDRTKLNKILSNLLENALKYTNEGMIEMGYFIENDLLKLYVKDTGIGISPKNHQLIFERFSQENKEMSRKHGGLGLGLSISKENAQLLGGDITLTSEKDKGSTFYVTIPYKPAQTGNDKTTEISITPKEADSKYTILIAEDEEVNYLYLEALLRNEIKGNIELIHAKNGKEAVDICARNKTIDLVLMDIKMPIMNGYEASERIKSQFPDLPIIAQTAYSTDSDRELAIKHGYVDFISKPINKEKLFGMINKFQNKK